MNTPEATCDINALKTEYERLKAVEESHRELNGRLRSQLTEYYQRGFNDGRDQALKAMVEICDGLVASFNPQANQTAVEASK